MKIHSSLAEQLSSGPNALIRPPKKVTGEPSDEEPVEVDSEGYLNSPAVGMAREFLSSPGAAGGRSGSGSTRTSRLRMDEPVSKRVAEMVKRLTREGLRL